MSYNAKVTALTAAAAALNKPKKEELSPAEKEKQVKEFVLKIRKDYDAEYMKAFADGEPSRQRMRKFARAMRKRYKTIHPALVEMALQPQPQQ